MEIQRRDSVELRHMMNEYNTRMWLFIRFIELINTNQASRLKIVEFLFPLLLYTKPKTIYMRMFPFVSLAFTFLMLACNNNKTKEANTIVSEDGKTKVTIDPSSVMNENGANDMTQKMEALKKLTPLSLDQLKAMLPDELAGMKRSNFSANSAMGFSLAEARYKGTDEDNKDLKLVIWDCAGEAGAGFYSLTYWTQFNMQSESDDGYTKSVDFNGGKAIEKYSKGSNEYELTYTYGDRLLVNIAGRNVPLDVVKQAASSLNLKTN